MNRNNHFVCCDQCFEEVGKRSTKAAKLWLTLCNIRMETGDVFALSMQDFPELRTLETLGFVTTTDKPLEVRVRVHGLTMPEDQPPFFCINKVTHAT